MSESKSMNKSESKGARECHHLKEEVKSFQKSES